MRRTLAQALASRIPTAVNLTSNDSRVPQLINSCTERLLHRGHWVGTVPRYSVSVTNQLLTLPPQFANIETVAVSQMPLTLRNQWYEFNANGIGVVKDPVAGAPVSTASQVLFRGNFCTNKDIAGTNSKVRVQCDVADDVNVAVLLLGLDGSGNWIRSKVGGVWQDGETVLVTQFPGTTSSNVFSKLIDIQKPVTNGQLWLYEIDGATNPLIGTLQYWETNPMYPRYLLPTIPGNATQVDLVGKLAFRPVTNPTDYLLIGNLEALRLGVMAIRAEEEHLFVEATALMNGVKDKNTGRVISEGAVTILEQELQGYLGDGAVPAFNIVGSSMFGDAVPALV